MPLLLLRSDRVAHIAYCRVVNVYGGPGNQLVNAMTGVGAGGNNGFHTYLVVSVT